MLYSHHTARNARWEVYTWSVMAVRAWLTASALAAVTVATDSCQVIWPTCRDWLTDQLMDCCDWWLESAHVSSLLTIVWWLLLSALWEWCTVAKTYILSLQVLILCQNQQPWITLNNHYSLCFKTHAQHMVLFWLWLFESWTIEESLSVGKNMLHHVVSLFNGTIESYLYTKISVFCVCREVLNLL